GPSAHLPWIEEINKLGREKQKQFLLYFIHVLQQCLHVRFTGKGITGTENERNLIARINKIASPQQQNAIISELNNAVYFIERNANAKMLFHALTIKLYHIIKNNNLILTA